LKRFSADFSTIKKKNSIDNLKDPEILNNLKENNKNTQVENLK